MNYARKSTGAMPRYTVDLLSDQEVADIHAYLTSVPPPVNVKTSCFSTR
jgi:mono/diheme cytochrome c family protein